MADKNSNGNGNGKDKQEPAMDRVNNNIYAASALRFLNEGKLDESASLVQYSYARRDEQGNYQVDALGALALYDFLRNGEHSGVGQRIKVDAERFGEGLEELSVEEMGESIVGKLGLGKKVLEKVVKDGGKTGIKKINEKLKELKYEQNQLTAKYERLMKEAKDDKDKKQELAREFDDKQKEIKDKYKKELRLSRAIGAAIRISTERVGSDTLIFGEYSGAKSPDEIEEMAQKAKPAHTAEELY